MATGRKTGGRKAGTPNKATAAKAAAIAASGLMPLDYMLLVMRDENREPAMRLDAAKAAAPYVHPRLASVEPGKRDNKAFEISTEEREQQAAEARRKAREAIAASFAELASVGREQTPDVSGRDDGCAEVPSTSLVEHEVPILPPAIVTPPDAGASADVEQPFRRRHTPGL